jgi:hypothetical protein
MSTDEELEARGLIVRNACECTVCGANADKMPAMYQCQANPNHYADLVTGLFDDYTYPEEPGR